jgi:hypothetical protein
MAHRQRILQKKKWKAALQRSVSKKLDAPSWLWSSVVDLVAHHETAYIEHCRRYALSAFDFQTSGIYKGRLVRREQAMLTHSTAAIWLGVSCLG